MLRCCLDGGCDYAQLLLETALFVSIADENARVRRWALLESPPCAKPRGTYTHTRMLHTVLRIMVI